MKFQKISFRPFFIMRGLCAVLLCSVLAVDLCQGAYPDDIDIEKQVLGLLAFSGRKVFCNMVFLTQDVGTADKSCFINIDLSITKIFALGGGRELYNKEQYSIDNTVKDRVCVEDNSAFNTKLAYIKLEEERQVNLRSLILGITPQTGMSDFGAHTSGTQSIKLYGYTDDNYKLPTSVNLQYVESYTETRVLYYEFQIDAMTQGKIFKGGPVLRNNHLIAICGEEPVSHILTCVGTNFIASIASEEVLEKLRNDIAESVGDPVVYTDVHQRRELQRHLEIQPHHLEVEEIQTTRNPFNARFKKLVKRINSRGSSTS